MKTTHDEKRRRVYEDLVRREQAAEGIREEESAKAKLRAEIERMRRAAEASRASSRPKSKTEASQSNVAVWLDGNSHELLDDLPARTVKVSWNRGTTSVDYDADQLRAIFSRYGTIADIIMKEGKKRKGSALITMVRQEDALEALEKLSSDPMSPLLVLPLRFAEDKKLKGGNSGKDKLQASKLASLSSTISKPGAKSSLGARPSKPLFPAAATGRND